MYVTYRSIKTRFRFASTYRLKLATSTKSLTHYTKGTLSGLKALQLLVSIQFQVLFHSPFGVLFTFPSRYLFTIGRLVVLSLGEWSPHFQTEFLVLRPTQKLSVILPLRDYHPVSSAFPCRSGPFTNNLSAGPISLATTFGVSVDFLSYRYLDVSVPCVRSLSTIYSCQGNHCWLGFPIRISADQCLFTAPHSFSQCITSFLASNRQGIH